MLLIAAKGQRGYSIVELMIAITLSLVMLAGLTTIFVNNSQARTEMERANMRLENGRYAMDVLAADLRNAGYLAEFDPGQLPTPAAQPDPCATSIAALTDALPLHVQGVDDASSVPACLSDVRDDTDILVVRRASTCIAGSADCLDIGPYFQVSLCTEELEALAPGDYNFTLDTNVANLTWSKRKPAGEASGCGDTADLRRYITHIYFVANNNSEGDAIPTLKRAELRPGAFTVVSLVEGIEDLQVEYGIDLPLVDGAPDAFTSAPGTIDDWRNVVAVKVHLLARSTTASPGHKDTKTYVLGLRADGVTENTSGPFGDGFKRNVHDTVVRLHNPAGRNLP